MNKGVGFSLAVFALAIFLAGFAVASFSYKEHNLETSYSAGDKIKGVINISLDSEPSDSLFKSNFNGSVKLIDLIKSNNLVEGIDYTCTYKECIDSYKTNGSAAGGASLSPGTPLIVGFKVTGEDIVISSIGFSLSSDAGPSCSNPLKIDVMDMNNSFIQGNKNSGEMCGGEYIGCFSDSMSGALADITSEIYCERITLASAPAYTVGAIIKNGTSPANIKMSLRNSDWQSIGECILPKPNLDIGRLGCMINYSVIETEDYFVCINSDANADYKIKTEEAAPTCGTSTGGEPFNIDFNIFARPMEFAPIGTMRVNESLFYALNNGGDIIAYVNSYIQDIYRGNCSAGCFIPFKISGITQNLTFSNSEVKYKKGSSPTFTENNLYKLEKDKSKITTPGTIKLNVGPAGLTIPIDSEANLLYLYLNNKEILPSPLSITVTPSFLFDITPKSILFGAKTNFQALSSSKMSYAQWTFGDGSSAASEGGVVSHRYTSFNKEGYKLEVELTREDGVKARNSFDISVEGLKDAATSLMNESESKLANITNQIDSYGPRTAFEIKRDIKTTEIKESFEKIKRELSFANVDEDYIKVINNLLAANLPDSIKISEEGTSIPFTFGLDSLNPSYIEQISSATIEESAKENLKNAIADWIARNYEGNINYDVISRTNDDGSKSPILTKAEVILNKKADAEESANEAFLIINYPTESISFAGNYSEKTVGSGTYIGIGDSSTIEFTMKGQVNIASLGMYLSPQINKLTGFEQVEIIQKEGFNWGRFIIWTILLLIAALSIYVALQEWYKKKYESYLFKNLADLYNVITFIYNSRKNGLADVEIAKKLKNAGWSGEQETYAFKKIDGKRTGMFEIPILRFFEQRKIKEEIEKRRMPAQSKPLLK